MQRSGVGDGGLGGEVRRLRRAAGRRARPRRPARAAACLHDRPAAARRAQERGADGRPGPPGPVRAWLVDDTGLPKKGKLSVGVARQYCGQLGKRDNCQVAVTLSVATEAASLPVAYRLYLPEAWADDPARRALAGVPEEVGFATKPSIALDQIGQALADGVPPGVVVADAG